MNLPAGGRRTRCGFGVAALASVASACAPLPPPPEPVPHRDLLVAVVGSFDPRGYSVALRKEARELRDGIPVSFGIGCGLQGLAASHRNAPGKTPAEWWPEAVRVREDLLAPHPDVVDSLLVHAEYATVLEWWRESGGARRPLMRLVTDTSGKQHVCVFSLSYWGRPSRTIPERLGLEDRSTPAVLAARDLPGEEKLLSIRCSTHGDVLLEVRLPSVFVGPEDERSFLLRLVRVAFAEHPGDEVVLGCPVGGHAVAVRP